MKTQAVPLHPLGGIDERFRVHISAADLAENVRFHPRGAWRVSRGVSALLPDIQGGSNIFESLSVGPIESLAWFQQAAGRHWLVWEQVEESGIKSGTYVCRLVTMTGWTKAFRYLQDERTYLNIPWEGTHYMAHGGWLYVMNGYDAPVRWSGDGFMEAAAVGTTTKTPLNPVGFTQLPPAPRVVGPDLWKWTDTDGWVNATARSCMGRWDQVPIVQPPKRANGQRYQGWAGFLPDLDQLENHAAARGVGPRAPNADLSSDPPHSNEAEWVYGYGVTWENDRGQMSPMSPITWVAGRNFGRDTGHTVTPTIGAAANYHTNGGKRYVFVECGGAPEHCVAIHVWRTDNVKDVEGYDGRRLRMHLLESHHTAGQVHILDGHGDNELGAVFDPDSVGLFPLNARLPSLFKGTLFVAVEGQLRYSAPVFIEQMPENNYLDVGERDGGRITAMYPTRNALVVFKARGIYLVRGAPGDWTVDTLTETDGAVCSHVREVPGLGLAFISARGPRLLEGALENTGTPTRVHPTWGSEVQRFWEREVNTAALAGVRVERNSADQELWWTIPTGATHRATKGLVYHYTVGAWSIRNGYPFGPMVESRDHRNHLYMGSHDSSAPGVWALSGSGLGVDGNAITGTWRTSHVGEHWDRSMRVPQLQVLVEDIGRAVSVDWRIDYAQAFAGAAISDVAYPHDLDADSIPLWDTAVWSATELAWTRMPVVQRYSIHATDYDTYPNGYVFQASFSSTKMTLIDASIEVKSPTPTNIPVRDAGQVNDGV